MKLLTFNIWNLFNSAHRQERMEAIGRMLKSAAQSPDGWDIVLLQEMWPVHDRRMFDDCGYPHAADPEQPWSRVQNWILAPWRLFGFSWIMDSGLRTLSSLPILETKILRFRSQMSATSKALHPETYIRKAALACRIETPDLGMVWVVNTHLVASNRRGNGNCERTFQLEQLRAWMDRELCDAHIILGGDLNMGPPIPGSRAERDEPEAWDEALAGPLNGFQAFLPTITDPTWTSATNPYVAADPDREIARLDHILVSPGLCIPNGRVVLTEEAELGGGQKGPLSDHYGYEAVVVKDC